jgi:hypothetical protein
MRLGIFGARRGWWDRENAMAVWFKSQWKERRHLSGEPDLYSSTMGRTRFPDTGVAVETRKIKLVASNFISNLIFMIQLPF